MNKITFSYSPYYDFLRWNINRKKREWLKKKDVVLIPFSFKNLFRVIFNQPKVNLAKINADFSVKCYWLSSGNWGSYSPSDKIFICPIEIERSREGSLEGVINHEILHLKYYEQTKNMTHDEKERFIKEKENS